MSVLSYHDYGVVAPMDEPRTNCLFTGANGREYFVISSRGFLMLLDLAAKSARQFIYPESYLAYPFGCLAAKSGLVYLGAGTMFMEFDPVKEAFTFYQHIHPDELAYGAWSPAEAPDGVIYFGAHPKTYLTAFDPKTRKLTDYGLMDDTQEYLATIAVDCAGWLYCTVGTQTQRIFAFHPQTGEKHIAVTLPDGMEGGAYVTLASDGNVYGTFEGGMTGSCRKEGYSYFQLLNGMKMGALTDASVSFPYIGDGFQGIHCPKKTKTKIIWFDLPEGKAVYLHPVTGEETTLSFHYQTAGADMSPLTLGPDGKIYGTTNHPIQFYSFDPKTEKITLHGKLPLSKERQTEWWGNVCAWASQGAIMAGCAYCGGFVTRVDTSKPLGVFGDTMNPSHEATHEEIYRPRAAFAYPDGKTIIFGGFTLNGTTGGGLVLYDVLTRKTVPIPNGRLAKYHSVLCMGALPNHRLLCGTTIEAPCGGYVYEKEAVLFTFDLTTQTVTDRLVPIAGATGISSMQQAQNGIFHAITLESICFSYDATLKKVLKTTDLSAYGAPVRDGMKLYLDGNIYGLLEHAIYCVNGKDGSVKIVCEPPRMITSGMAIQNNQIYFGSDTHLCSCSLSDEVKN
ncbi:MAG: hypothetical protein RSC73_03970 [Ruthenibacterium sp.]